MIEQLPEWLEQKGRKSGVVGCLLQWAGQPAFCHSLSEPLAEPVVQELCQRLTQIATELDPTHETANQYRWTYENGELYLAIRPEGSVLCLVRSGRFDGRRPAAVQRLITEFLQASPAASSDTALQPQAV